MTGVGRTGTFLAVEQWGAVPDLVVLAKGLSSGYAPLAAVLIHERVFRAFQETGTNFIGGHTYNAHPVTAGAGISVLEYLEKHRILEKVGEKGSVLARASFETPIRHIINAALIGEEDKLNSVVENVMMNQPVPVGTGLPDLVTKVKK